jgi:DNA invertase Pin-like site-specific DNA recombinase
MRKAVGYIRCSTEEQNDSPEQQKREILTFAKKNNLEILEWFVDFGKSGTTFEQRPEFRRLRAVIEDKPKFHAVICYDESRWGRAIDSDENIYWRVYFRKHGVEVLLVKTSVDPTNEFAPMLSAFEGVQASSYSKKLSELILRGALANGIYSNGGFAPYGFKRKAINIRTGEERVLEKGQHAVHKQEKVIWIPGDQNEIKIVQRIFEERASGKSAYLIAKDLNKDGIPPPAGRGTWGATKVSSIIINDTYYGARVYNRRSYSKIIARQQGRQIRYDVDRDYKFNDKSDWLLHENAHESIVTKELWNKANEMKRRYSGPKKKNHDAPYLLTE